MKTSNKILLAIIVIIFLGIVAMVKLSIMGTLRQLQGELLGWLKLKKWIMR